MNDDSYTVPVNSNTPLMTVPSILLWLDLEIDYLKEKQATESDELVRLILEGIWCHLEDMKDQLGNYTMQRMDEKSK